ncbi:MAG TPA: hypothetical protein VMU83_16115 [Hanamia sp.]|nr:hypothetical protein [Hanamia sp.]
MEAIKLTGTSHNGKLTVSVPEEYDNKELELMIISSTEMKSEKEGAKKIKNNERAEKFMRLVGSAKHPDFPKTKYDVYDQ